MYLCYNSPLQKHLTRERCLTISFMKDKNMLCAVFRFLQFVGMGYFPKLFVVVLVVVKYEIINIRESISMRNNLNIKVGDIYTGKLMGQKI